MDTSYIHHTEEVLEITLLFVEWDQLEPMLQPVDDRTNGRYYYLGVLEVRLKEYISAEDYEREIVWSIPFRLDLPAILQISTEDFRILTPSTDVMGTTAINCTIKHSIIKDRIMEVIDRYFKYKSLSVKCFSSGDFPWFQRKIIKL